MHNKIRSFDWLIIRGLAPTMGTFLVFLLLVALGQGGLDNLCPTKFRTLSFPENSTFQNLGKQYLPFCSDFSQNTCCSKQDSTMLLRELHEFSGDSISSRCWSVAEKALCFGCQSKLKLKACFNFCSELLDACMESFFDFSTAKLKGCSESSIVCSQLKDASDFNSAKGICEYFGLTIEANEEVECYYGKDDTVSYKKVIHEDTNETYGYDNDLTLIMITLLALALVTFFIFFF